MATYKTKKYQVMVRKGVVGERFYNPLEKVWYEVTEKNVNTELVLMGTVGEMWLSPTEKVIRDYEGDMTFNSLWHAITRKPGGKVWAEKVTEEILVTTCSGYNLHPEIGDYLVCSANEDGTPDIQWGYWTIQREVFENTYEIV